MKNLNVQSGLSLVEIMVALVISLFLLSGIVTVYIGNKATYRFADTTSRIQENARFALDAIATDARMAGFWGCTDLQADRNGDGLLEDENKYIQNHLDKNSNYIPIVHDFINTPSITATVNNGINGSDSLTLRGAKPGQSVFLANLVQPGSGDIIVSENDNLVANDIILISNCYTGNIFEATAVDTTNGTTTISHSTAASTSTPGNTNLNDCAGAGAHCLMKEKDAAYTTNNAAAFALQTVTYSIENNANGQPVLMRSVNTKKEELIEGVEQLQVLFGEDTDGDSTPNQYLPSNQVANLQNVTAIRIWLVLRSDEANVVEKSQSYTINGQVFNPGDFRMRQVFSSTIALRNKEG